MSRDGMWPRFLSRLSRFRTPHIATLVIGAIICIIAAIGLVDFLSYISSSGYLFVLFWSNLALIRLRKRYPDLKRPFKTPFFPITVYLAMATCFLIIAFTERRALIFGIVLIAVLTIVYYLSPIANRIYVTRIKSIEESKDRILVPVSNPKTGARLVHLATILAQASEDTNICVFNVIPSTGTRFPLSTKPIRRRLPSPQYILSGPVMREAQSRNVPLYTKIREAATVSKGILDEIESHQNVKFVLAGWPGPLDPDATVENPVKILLEKAQTNILVLLGRNLGKIHNILVPVGGGLHSRLALRLAIEVAVQENARITALHALSTTTENEEIEDKMIYLREIVEEELGFIPPLLTTRVALADSVINSVLEETKRQAYDLLVMGASEEWGSGTRLFGSVDDWIIEHVDNCSVLLVRHYEPVAIHWLRRHFKMIMKEY